VAEEYEVEKIIKHRQTKQSSKNQNNNSICYEYYIKWKNWDNKFNTWEHQDNISANCQHLMDKYWKSNQSNNDNDNENDTNVSSQKKRRE